MKAEDIKNKLLERSKTDTAKVRSAMEKSGEIIKEKVNNVCENSGFEEFKQEIKEDLDAIQDRDPANKSRLEAALLYSGFHAILAYRLSHKLYQAEHYTSARAVSQAARFLTGIEIHPGATIGKGLFIDHGSGVVIGETTIIGDNCTLYQGVTLGGTGKDKGKRHPTLGNNVMVGAGAKVLGPFKVGDNTNIAAGAVVLEEIPANCTAVGVPAQVVKRDGIRVDELDQIHVPDPVKAEIESLQMQIDKLMEIQEKIR